jgi:hypothetical protein
MALKSQNSRMYRGLLWVGRAYRLAGWLGLAATICFAVGAFAHHLRLMWDYVYFTRVDILLQCLLLATLILITGLVLSAVAFGISLGIQVGLTMMENSQTQIALLRRIAQQQSEDDSVLNLNENALSEQESLLLHTPIEQQMMRRAK